MDFFFSGSGGVDTTLYVVLVFFSSSSIGASMASSMTFSPTVSSLSMFASNSLRSSSSFFKRFFSIFFSYASLFKFFSFFIASAKSFCAISSSFFNACSRSFLAKSSFLESFSSFFFFFLFFFFLFARARDIFFLSVLRSSANRILVVIARFRARPPLIRARRFARIFATFTVNSRKEHARGSSFLVAHFTGLRALSQPERSANCFHHRRYLLRAKPRLIGDVTPDIFNRVPEMRRVTVFVPDWVQIKPEIVAVFQ